MQNRNYLNIDAYIEDGVLYARFDTSILVLEFEESDKAKSKLDEIISLSDLSAVAERFTNESMTNSDYSNRTVLPSKYITKHLLQISPKELDNSSFKGESTIKPITINVNPSITLKCHHASITYRISNIPHVMINWLAFFSIYYNQIKDRRLFAHLQFADHSQFVNLNEAVSIKNLYQADNCLSLDTTVILFMKKMISLKPGLAGYQDAFNDLEKVCEAYESNRNSKNSKPLLQCLFESTRSELVYGEQVEKFSTLKVYQEKESHFSSLTLTNEATAKKLECLFMLEAINSSAKINLIMSCLGKIAHDKGKYNISYTELVLMYFAEFHLFPNGTMGIINLDKNFGYLKDYAEGKRNHNILAPELGHLANVLGLELEPDCDYHKDKQILFTPACSLQLANMGLHLNGNYSKELFHVYQIWVFFTKLQLRDDNNVFSKLSNDLIDTIIVEANPSYKGMYNKIHPGFFQAVASGRERATQEYKEKQEEKMNVGFQF